jgi:hypothetical protein
MRLLSDAVVRGGSRSQLHIAHQLAVSCNERAGAGKARRPYCWRMRFPIRSSSDSTIIGTIEAARESAKRHGVADHITFEVASAKEYPGKDYELWPSSIAFMTWAI